MTQRVASADSREGVHDLIPRVDGSSLALRTIRLGPDDEAELPAEDDAVLLFTLSGDGTLQHTDPHGLVPWTTALTRPGEAATLHAGPEGIAVVCGLAGSDCDLHAPLGPPRATVALDHVEPGQATGSRSFQVLYGPHNGSTRATLFAGYIPPGRAPWHFHLYDEIVWVLRGTGRLHLGGDVEDIAPGCAFRLRPREVHIVENTQEREELVVLGLFTPAGSPSAAYLEPDVAETYAIAG